MSETESVFQGLSLNAKREANNLFEERALAFSPTLHSLSCLVLLLESAEKSALRDLQRHSCTPPVKEVTQLARTDGKIRITASEAVRQAREMYKFPSQLLQELHFPGP